MTYLWIFVVFDVGALVLVAAELWTARAPFARRAHRMVRPGAAVLALLATYFVQLGLTAYVASHQAPPGAVPAWVPPPPMVGAIPYLDLVSATALFIGAAQSVLLLALYRNPPSTRIVVAGAVALLALAWGAPVIFSGDAYAYIGDGLLGLAAYNPPAVRFHGDLAAINDWWGTPLPRTVYGPLWIVVVSATTAPFASLLGKLFALRTLCVAVVGSLLLVLRALALPRRILVVAALNPAIAFLYVTNAHNDLIGIVAILAAALFVRRQPAIAFALMTSGALVKLPFAIFALPLLGAMRRVWLRAAFCVGVPATAAAITWLAGGSGFLRAAAIHAASSGIAALLTAAVGIAALVAMAAAVANGRRLQSAVWLIPLTTAFTCSWYLVWSLPYALARHRVLGYFLVAFPLAAAAIDVKLMRPWTLFVAVPALFAWQVVALRGSARKAAA